jgi:prepilin peptidase CpaA
MNPIALTAGLAAAFMIAGAAVQDFRTQTISNAWPLVIILLFFAAFPFGVIPGTLGSHLLHFALALAVGMGLFALGWFGGGDAKLYAAAALWFALDRAVYLLLCVVIAGAVLALVHIGIRLLRRPGEGRARGIKDGKIAYGVAIALGAMTAAAGTV